MRPSRSLCPMHRPIRPSPTSPETGEEIYHGFLGVPILRAGNTLGVLVVQNRAHRSYSEEEIEAAQTTAMVVAEMIASGELQAIAQEGADIALKKPLYLQGVSLTEGVGLGHVVLARAARGGEDLQSAEISSTKDSRAPFEEAIRKECRDNQIDELNSESGRRFR